MNSLDELAFYMNVGGITTEKGEETINIILNAKEKIHNFIKPLV